MPTKKGTRYKCEECGLIVEVADPCGCEPTCHIMCCGVPMKETASKSRK